MTNIELLENENRELRLMLWFNHGCDFHSLYGDDGNMNCNACGIDFRSMTTDEIKETWRRRNLAKVEAEGGVDALWARLTGREAP